MIYNIGNSVIIGRQMMQYVIMPPQISLMCTLGWQGEEGNANDA